MYILFALILKQLVAKAVKVLVEIALAFACVINHLNIIKHVEDVCALT